MRTECPQLDVVMNDGAVRRLAGAISSGGNAAVVGAVGSSTGLVAGALARLSGRMVVLVVAHVDDADEAVEELGFAGIESARFPALEFLPGETKISLELFAERLSVVRALSDGRWGNTARVLVCPVQGLMQGAPPPGELEGLSRVVERGASAPGGTEGLARWLSGAGYKRVDSVSEPGDFAVRGGIVDVFCAGCVAMTEVEGEAPLALSGAGVRVDFFGDEVESLTEIDLETMGSDRRLRRVEIVGAEPSGMMPGRARVRGMSVLEMLPDGAVGVLAETQEVVEQARGYYERVEDSSGIFGPPAVLKTLRERTHGLAEVNQFSASVSGGDVRIELPVRVLPEFSRETGEAVAELGGLSRTQDVVVVCQNEGERQRLGELLAEFAGGDAAGVRAVTAYVHRGFVWGGEDDGGAGGRATAVVPYHELLHRFQTRRRVRRLKAGRTSEAFYEIEPGDYVVHADHGIAKFAGMRTITPRGPKLTAREVAERTLRGETEREGAAEEYITLEFAQGSKLHVPVSQIDKVQKYIGGFRGKPRLSVIGGKKWQNQKSQVKEAVRDLAGELLRVQAARESLPGIRYPADTAWQKEFEAEFPYEETEDQLAALGEIKKDMSSTRPMDRLLCGDVGYGKTELAIRAAFKAAEYGKQVAVLVPTTLLAEQHERTFASRFADYPFRVASLSRFKTAKETSEVLERVRKGGVDILIGTHRILSKDVEFADLGLVIIDEEQRFGVEHKQALLGLRLTADILTLSATPIPRTLHMSMLGLRDISSLATPPLDRRAVVTEVIPYNERRIASAIARELNRDGQVYFVHNRVHNIKSVADEVQKLAPGARIVIGHGQMPDGELEGVMRRFVRREADILVSTTIIESGIDIPTANTMFINGADHFGLADLHQLRGRVGRYKHRAYCYLLLPNDKPATDTAVRRLRAIEEFSMLGAGFKIAMRDLEIRGAGNLLGAEQSGHISAVGYDMYCRLLEQAARELRSEPSAAPVETTIEIGVAGVIPKAYIPSDARRLEAYRRLSAARTQEELAGVGRDLEQAYGAPPRATQRLLDLAELRIACAGLRVRSVSRHEQDVILRCEDAGLVAPILEGKHATVRVLAARHGELMEVYYRPPASYLAEPDTLLLVLRKRLAGAGGARSAGVGVR